MANGSFFALGDIVKTMRLDEEGHRFLQLHLQNQEVVITNLSEKRKLCHCIYFVCNRMLTLVQSPDDVADPTILGDTASLLTFLLAEYPSCLPEEYRDEAAQLLEVMLGKCVRRIAEAAQLQITDFSVAINQLVEFIGSLQLGNARILLVELPIGNSIAVKLIVHSLGKLGISFEVVRSSLSRNDAAKHGMTRERLLLDTLTEFGLQDNDIILYIDEWLTGSNFYRICRILKRVIRNNPNIFLLPVGLLSEAAPLNEKFESQHRPSHDSICQRFGIDGGRLRYIIRPVPTRFPREGYFFWSEHDRTSGYRKMQFLGSFFSSLDATVQKLRDSTDELLRAKMLLVTELAKQLENDIEKTKMLGEVARANGPFEEIFDESYADYEQSRQKLSELQHESNLGTASNPEDALDEVSRLIYDQIKDGKAKFCVELALLHMHESPDLNPHDRYYFKSHAPVIYELEGEYKRLHELWMSILLQKLESGEITDETRD